MRFPGGALIKISVRGLAKFMTSTPSGQRKVLADYKYPDDDEPSAMRLYYKDASDRIVAFHRSGHPAQWLREKAEEIAEVARLTPGPAGTRLRHNARAVLAYQTHFADRRLDPQSAPRLKLEVGGVTISVTPDMLAFESQKPRLVKLDFSATQPSADSIKIVSQVMLEAAAGRIAGLSSSSVRYLDVPRGVEHKAARAGARTLREVEAACANIESLWPDI